MKKIADTVKGQGVDTAYNELIDLLNKYDSNDLEIVKNKGIHYDIQFMHTVNPISYFKQRISKGKSLTYVHFLPDSLDGAIKIPKLFIKIYNWWVKKCYLKSDYLVVVNPSYIEEMKKLGYKKEAFYIPNYVSSEWFYPYKINKKTKLKKQYGYKENDFIVVSTGQLHKGKGVLDFIELAKENPDIQFLWIGGFNFGKYMEGYNEIKEIYDNPFPNLKFTGVIDRKEVNTYLNISDVFFLPSYYESFSLATLEAAHVEKPIILRNIDTYKDIYKENVLYGNNNEEFIKDIRELKDNKSKYQQYAMKTKKIKDTFSDEKIFKMWITLFKKISNK